MARFYRRLRRLQTGWKALQRPPRGLNPFYDLGYLVDVRTVFDVGANIGQSAAEYLKLFPQAEIHSFEPQATTFRALKDRFRSNPRVKPYHLALGAEDVEAMLLVDDASDLSRISEEGTEAVTVRTMDSFCQAEGIGRIDFLKIDTEGHDLQVLQGAEALLAARQIAIIQVEAGMNPDNHTHVPFEQLKGFLEARGYRLFGIYEQAVEWPTQEVHLRRTNPIFISGDLRRG